MVIAIQNHGDHRVDRHHVCFWGQGVRIKGPKPVILTITTSLAFRCLCFARSCELMARGPPLPVKIPLKSQYSSCSLFCMHQLYILTDCLNPSCSNSLPMDAPHQNSSSICNMNDYLLPRVVDEAASKYPHKLWMTVPRSGKLDQGWRDLTFRDLGRAVNNLARWMDRTVGFSNDREPVAYLRYEPTLERCPWNRCQ